ncbi:MAG: hypothetical protein LQ339_002710 [Xanthoria mediterranea]|nr:MAG: hypothetical protein LQ339_002710 [Xanthoria mediterranea]
MVMPPTPDAANRLIHMAVENTRFYYYKHHSPDLEQLQSLSGSEFECVGDVNSVGFDRDAIRFTQHKRGTATAMVELQRGEYTLQSVTVEKPFEPGRWKNVETVMVVHIVCHRRPQSVFTLHRHEAALPLARYASQMHFIRVEFSDICSWWEVSRRNKGWTNAAVQTQLEQLFALYTASTLCGPESEPEHTMPFYLSNKRRLCPTSGPEASPWSEAESDTAATPAHPPPSSRNPPEIPLPTIPYPPTSRALTSTLLPQPSATSTILQHPRVLKRKLDEMIVHYDAIEEEEKKSIASCHEKKGKLWADWRSTNPPRQQIHNILPA